MNINFILFYILIFSDGHLGDHNIFTIVPQTRVNVVLGFTMECGIYYLVVSQTVLTVYSYAIIASFVLFAVPLAWCIFQ